MIMEKIVIDASDCVVGRLASFTAKKALNGTTVHIVNADKAIISGNPKHIINNYKEKVERGDPYHGPMFPRRPDAIIKRTIRGMIPYKSGNGKDAFKRVKVFVSVPEEYVGQTLERIDVAESKLTCKRIALGELSERLGAKKTW